MGRKDKSYQNDYSNFEMQEKLALKVRLGWF
jgi:hypothetical protein